MDAAWQSVGMAMQDVFIYNIHGINGATPEQTMRNIGQHGHDGMRETDKEIVKIMMQKH